MAYIECRQIELKKSDKASIEREVEAACKEKLVWSGHKGFPLLLDLTSPFVLVSSVTPRQNHEQSKLSNNRRTKQPKK